MATLPSSEQKIYLPSVICLLVSRTADQQEELRHPLTHVSIETGLLNNDGSNTFVTVPDDVLT